MRTIYFSIILLLSLQSYSIYAEQHHPLAELWNVDDTEVPKLLEIERNLTAIDDILSPILEQDDFISSFGGSYIDMFKIHIVVNTVKFSKRDDLLALPQIKPFQDFLFFKKANHSMSQIKSNFEQIKLQIYLTEPKRVFIFSNMVDNNNFLFFLDGNHNNTEFINATKPFNPTIIYEDNPPVSQNTKRSRYDVDSRELKFKVLGGDGLYNDQSGGVCSVGFWVTDRFNPNEFYIITAGHCFDKDVSRNEFSYAPWGAETPALYIGPMEISMINPYDFGIIYLNGKDVAPTFAIRNDDADQYKELIINDGAPASSVGIHMCKSGHKTHLSCGYVFGLNGIYIEEKDDMKEDLIITNMKSDFGDSGGTVFSFVSPQNLDSVVGRGINFGGGHGIEAAQSLNTIFIELEKLSRYFKLYLGD
ncbi:hypothetical protein C2G38_2130432 [Gigaspora rosea]|uniref:Peptidase S1 domain-containing protein n=1 Tax=Gigaspora rosea TaxID=44941 RepID=A0A397TPL4_9GLOM|nr:hypothetical protein C2G38_2130432 [Gigaspora rosea]